jgi:hypothetical protein
VNDEQQNNINNGRRSPEQRYAEHFTSVRMQNGQSCYVRFVKFNDFKGNTLLDNGLALKLFGMSALSIPRSCHHFPSPPNAVGLALS